jgi:metal-responsive CopG/Arc/MetJ family transcriptional regulator
MKTATRYKALSVTVPAEMERALSAVCKKEIRKKSEVVQEALRLYFGARSGKASRLSFVMPSTDQDRKHTDLSAFAPEWSSALDSVYDSLGK